MKIKFEWEIIGDHTSRAKVIGGWILNTSNSDYLGRYRTETTTFIPDPEHKWEIEE